MGKWVLKLAASPISTQNCLTSLSQLALPQSFQTSSRFLRRPIIQITAIQEKITSEGQVFFRSRSEHPERDKKPAVWRIGREHFQDISPGKGVELQRGWVASRSEPPAGHSLLGWDVQHQCLEIRWSFWTDPGVWGDRGQQEIRRIVKARGNME